MKVYLAGPLGFSEAGRHFQAGVLLPRLRGMGLQVIDPWALTDEAECVPWRTCEPARPKSTRGKS